MHWMHSPTVRDRCAVVLVDAGAKTQRTERAWTHGPRYTIDDATLLDDAIDEVARHQTAQGRRDVLVQRRLAAPAAHRRNQRARLCTAVRH